MKMARWTIQSPMTFRPGSTDHLRLARMNFQEIEFFFTICFCQVIIGATWDETADVLSSSFSPIQFEDVCWQCFSFTLVILVGLKGYERSWQPCSMQMKSSCKIWHDVDVRFGVLRACSLSSPREIFFLIRRKKRVMSGTQAENGARATP